MGRYPAWVVKEYYDALRDIYGWTTRDIETATGVAGAAAPGGTAQRYPNDRHVLALMRVLDGLGYYSDQQLRMADDAQRAALGFPPPATAMRLVIAELRNSATVADFLSCAAARLGKVAKHCTLWTESIPGGALRLCHSFVYAEENFSGPQRLFVFLLLHLQALFAIDRSLIRVTFPAFGIRDPQGFTARTGCAFNRDGAISSIELDAAVIACTNPLHNPLSSKAVAEALDDLLAGLDDNSLTAAVERLLEQHLAQQHRSLDIAAVAACLGISRATLFRRLREEGELFRDLRSRSRLAHAARLLRTTKRDIGVISAALGYSETSAFSRAFKAQNGISPNEYRLKHGLD